jgi:hypothetical protein
MAQSEDDKTRGVRNVLKNLTREGPWDAGKYYENYRKSYPGFKVKGIHPTANNLLEDSVIALQAAQEAAMVRLSSLFEAFAQCWALNIILAYIEDQCRTLVPLEQDLLALFCPFGESRLPSAPKILLSLDPAYKLLISTPRMFNNPKTKLAIHRPETISDSAFVSIMFWRDYRNLFVHYGGRVTTAFFAKYGSYFEEAMKPLGHLRLEVGKPLPYHDDLYGAMGAAHYRAVLELNEWLERESKGRRGHPEAPRPKSREIWEDVPLSPPLLLEGDHAPSLAWVTDAGARAEIATARGWLLEREKTIWSEYD